METNSRILHDMKRIAAQMERLARDVAAVSQGSIGIIESLAVIKVHIDRLYEDVENGEKDGK